MVDGGGKGAACPKKAAILSVQFAPVRRDNIHGTAAILTGLAVTTPHKVAKGAQPDMAGMMVLQGFWRGMVALGLTVVVVGLAGAAARAENLDQGKSGPKLFADTCAACHRSARGLAKGRFSLTLYLYLQKHYASNSSSAWELTSYLESLDDAPRGRSKAASTKSGSSTAAAKPAPSTWAPQSSLRPPASVPQR